MTGKHIPETKLVDYVLGHLTQEEEAFIAAHLHNCSRCQQEAAYWQEMFATEASYTPSPTLNEKIRQISQLSQLNNNNKRLKEKRSPKWKYVISMLAATILIAFTMNEFIFQEKPLTNEHMKQGYIIAQQEEIPENIYLVEPAANRHDIVTLTNDNINGELWLNKETNEILFLAEGLRPLEAADYQLWVVHADDYWNGQLLHLREGAVRVYYKSPDIKLLKYLKVSVEPQGGSLTPTGPEILYVDLKEK